MKSRIFYFDLLRVFAAICVIVIHVADAYQFYASPESTDFIISNIFNSVAHMAVPLFVMISGAFMLDEKRQISTKQFLKKYVLNLTILLIIWSAFYTIKHIGMSVIRSEGYGIKDFLEDFLLADGGFHLWYLYMVIGLYLITPVLKLFVCKENKNKILYLIIILSVFTFLPSMLDSFNNEYVQIFSSFFKTPILTGGAYISYYLLGWYLSNFQLEKKHRIIVYILGFFGLLYTILAGQFVSIAQGVIAENVYKVTALNLLLYSVAIFILFKQLFQNTKESKFTKFISHLSKLSFGVYLIHLLVFSVFTRVVPDNAFILIKLALVSLATIIVCFLTSFVISKIPFIKKLIRG